MPRSLTIPAPYPPALAPMLGNPKLLGPEKPEEYWPFFIGIADVVQPQNTIEWLYVGDAVYLAWENRREKFIKRDIINLSQRQVIRELKRKSREMALSGPLDKAQQNEQLQWAEAEYGKYGAITQAYVMNQREIDAVDRRITNNEVRIARFFHEIRVGNTSFVGRLQQTVSETIEMNGAEAAE